MGEQFGILLTYAGAVILILIFGKIFLWPLKLVLKLVLNSIAGGLIILLFNTVCAGLGLWIPLNFINAILVGFLGLPGAVLLLILTCL